MKKRRMLATIMIITFLTAVSCGRKGTGCPTFSKAVTTQLNILK